MPMKKEYIFAELATAKFREPTQILQTVNSKVGMS